MRRRAMGALLAALIGTPVAAISAGLTLGAAPAAAVTADPYTWKSVAIGGGGFVPGIEFSRAQKNLIYARTDIGGAYRWDAASSSWTPLLDWVGQSNWGYNGVVSIAPDPVDANKVYAAVGMYTNDWDPNNGAILRSSDKGNTWQTSALPFKLGGNMPGRGMGERLAVDPNKNSVLYFAAPSGKGLWRSTDSGATWAQVTSFPNPGNYVQDPSQPYTADNQGDVWVAFDTSTSTSGTASKGIYVGVADVNHPVYRSLDGGATWSELAGAPTGYLPHKGVIDPTNHLLYIATSDTGGPYDGKKGDVWKYNIATSTWTQISPIPSSSSDDYFGYSGLTIDRQHPSTLMVATQVSWWPDAIFWRSTDSGATWTRIWDWTSYPSRSLRYTMDVSANPWLNFGNTSPVDPVPAVKLGWMNESVEIDPFNSDHLLYGTGATIYGTSNLTAWDTGGKVLIQPVVKGMEETAVLDLISPPTGAPLLSGLGDVSGFRHDDLTKVPASMYTQPLSSSTTSLDYAETNPSIMARAVNFTKSDQPNDYHASFSTDGGKTWFEGSAEPGGVNTGGSIAAAADGSRFVWAPGDPGIQVVYSVGFGNTWTPSQGLPANAIVRSDRVNPKKFYAIAGGKFYVSTDGGATFTASTDPSASGLPGSYFKPVPGHEGELWLANGSGGLLHSTNSGASFTKVTGVDSAKSVGLGKAAPGQSAMALFIVGSVGGVSGFFRSDDSGATWVQINDAQHQYGNAGDAITGDPRIYGRFYLGTNGRGIIYGDRTGTTPTPTPTPTTPTPTPTTPTPTPTTPTPTPTTPTPTPTTPTPTPTTGKTCTAAYSIASQWPGGFQGGVTVTAGSSAINGWTVKWTWANGQTLVQAWGATATASGSTITATNLSWNGSLAAKASASMGFVASWNNSTNAIPTVSCTAQ